MYKTLILGGYGNFGKRIAESLAGNNNIELLIAGRNLQKAEFLCQKLASQNTHSVFTPVVIDIHAAGFEAQLKSLAADIVVHTSGPFQGQSHRVPAACIAAGSHYIDLADDRRFVCDITSLDEKAKEQGVLVVSGASSVPGLSSVVIDHYLGEFSSVEAIDIAIAPGNKAERGEATVRGILSYTGYPYKTLQQGEWGDSYGWMSPRKLPFGDNIGSRWLANVDVPDLELFPARYPSVKNMQFQAGLEVPVLHLTMVAMAWLAKKRLVPNWAPLTQLIMAVSEWFTGFGTADGAMRVSLQGEGADGSSRKQLDWTLFAYDGVGPYIPTLSAVIIANKLIRGELDKTGAVPCLGLYSLDEFYHYADKWAISHKVEVSGGELSTS